MNTLHMYHWMDQSTLAIKLPMLGLHDSLVIYGSMSADDITYIKSQMQNRPQPWYLVKSSTDPIMDSHEINEAQWIKLITEHKNSWAWK